MSPLSTNIQIDQLVEQTISGNVTWRLLISLAIIVIGYIIIEILFRKTRQRIQKSLEDKGKSPKLWHLQAFLPPLRLAIFAVLLRIAEEPLVVPERLAQLLHGLEAFLLALAIVVLAFQLVTLLDNLRLTLPAEFQERFPQKSLSKLKKMLRLFILIGVIAIFIYHQRNILPDWIVTSPMWRYILLGAIFVVIYQAIRVIGKFISDITTVLKDSEENVRLHLLLKAAMWPIGLLLISVAVYSVKEILDLSKTITQISDTTIGVLSTLAIIVFLYRLIELLVYELDRFAQREDNMLDRNFVQMIRLIARVVVIVVGAIYLLRALSGKPLSALLAGVGIGGLAVALAAQDTLKNFFGSLMIMLDKPFSVGQRVLVENYDGVVEDIGFRSTRVRTLTGHLVTVPNEKMATNAIENVGRRPSIRRLTNITITYDTPPDKVERALEIIREILDNHEGMNPDFPPRVYFSEFNDASLNVMMIYWYFPADYWAYMEFTEKVNLKIMRAFEKEGIEFAFPTTTTYLAHDERRPLQISIDSDKHFLTTGRQER
ncbi:MAG: mechanosensitive ion channel [Deltaproteobacteria bacterium]|nr:MAG: mechanosensitive ion channel [Deltaproteobacteria bacterium]